MKKLSLFAGLILFFFGCKKNGDGNLPVTAMDTIITTVAGNGTWGFSGDGDSAIHAQLSMYCENVAVDAAGNIYVGDKANDRIRKINTAGIITTIAGTGIGGFSGDGGPAINAKLQSPAGITITADGAIFFADQGNGRIRKISPDGIITTVAGRGNTYVPNLGDDSVATKASLSLPSKVTFDAAGNMYIADMGDHRIRKVSKTSGLISTIAGKGNSNNPGDNEPALNAYLRMPKSLKFDRDGNLIIIDVNIIRKINTAGIITTIAGDGTYGYTGDGGPATSCQLWATDLDIDRAGNIYIAAYGNSAIRKISTNGIITSIAGPGRTSVIGDGGHPRDAFLLYPTGIALNARGDIFIADYGTKRIRKITYP